LARVRRAVCKRDPVGRGSELQVFLEIIIHRCFLVSTASSENRSSSKQQIGLSHKNSFPTTGYNAERVVYTGEKQMIGAGAIYIGNLDADD
jgi:hypothetical protein